VSCRIKSIGETRTSNWDAFVGVRGGCSAYQLSGWGRIIGKSYGHDAYHLTKTCCFSNSTCEDSSAGGIEKNRSTYPVPGSSRITGILPLAHMRSIFFGNNLTSLPYFDSAGILADNTPVEVALLRDALELAGKLGCSSIELRQLQTLLSVGSQEDFTHRVEIAHDEFGSLDWNLSISTNKVRMLLDLPDSPEALMKTIKSKLRSQIRKPIKEGLTVKIGKAEILDDFYSVFCVNMRDLGSPVHSRKFFSEILREFPESSNVFVVYRGNQPMACSLVIGFKETLSNPWASSLRRYRHLAPNMLLYWAMLEFACLNGYSIFDFGRSTPDESTFKFKEQWGARPVPLYWYRFEKKGSRGLGVQPDRQKMSKAIEYWKRLPLPLTKLIGPHIRKYINL
jgi:serine/alanine adding enzyme